MDQNVILDAIDKQMDAPESIYNWTILLTIPVTLAGFRIEEKVTVFNWPFLDGSR